jgi:hypothetical protein
MNSSFFEDYLQRFKTLQQLCIAEFSRVAAYVEPTFVVHGKDDDVDAIQRIA